MKYLIPVLLLLFSCGTQSDQKEDEVVLSPVAFATKIKETPDAIILDVRTPEEMANGYIENAINIVYDDAFQDKLADLPNKPVFVYCGSGKRSAKAAQILRAKGYAKVYELQGGMNSWREASQAVVTPTP